MTATASAVTATADEDLDECGPQLLNKLEVVSVLEYNKFIIVLSTVITNYYFKTLREME